MPPFYKASFLQSAVYYRKKVEECLEFSILLLIFANRNCGTSENSQQTSILYMKKLFLILLLSFLSVKAWCKDGDQFTATNDDGVEFGFEVTNEELKICRVWGIDKETSSDIRIPDVVTHDGKEYRVKIVSDRGFEGFYKTTYIYLPSNVSAIGERAFQDCIHLESIVNSGVIITLGHGAFWGCTSLNNINLALGVETIGNYVFCGCSSLTTIDLPQHITSIGLRAFQGCSSLKNITIPNSVTSIGDEAFYGCISLTSLYIPSSVQSIGNDAFFNCNSLASIEVDAQNSYYDSRNNCNAIIKKDGNELILGCRATVIPNSVISIGKGAFYDCSGLPNMNIPQSVISIGNNAFKGCSGLTYVSIPNSVTSIGKEAFSGCTGLTYITIPNSVVFLGVGAFMDCKGLNRVSIGSSLTALYSNSFYGCSALTFLVIGKNVETIDDSAFASCPNLADVYITAETVPDTHNKAFNNSYIDNAVLHVPSASINDYRATIPWRDFGNIVALNYGEPDVINENIVTINGINYCLKTQDNQKTAQVVKKYNKYKGNIVIPETVTYESDIYNVTSIGNGAFFECNEIESITMPNSILSIGKTAFAGCSGLSTITIPNSVYSIEWSAFSGCINLSSITIGSYVRSIGNNAFWGCSKLTDIDFPNTVSTIGDYAFCGCSSLSAIKLPYYISSIGAHTFENCSAISSIIIPNTVTTIDTCAFANCKSLISIDIPNSVKYIRTKAFYGCSKLVSVTIGNGIKQFLSESFASCPSLRDFFCYAPSAPDVFYLDTFDNSHVEKACVYIPSDAYNSFVNSNGWVIWRSFFRVVRMDMESTMTLTAGSYSREYGENNPEFSYGCYEGSIPSPVLNGEPYFYCSATKESPVGTYDIIITRGSVETGNKVLKLENGTLTITKAPLTVSVGDYIMWEGEAYPEFSLTYCGFKNDETKEVLINQPVVSCTATSSSRAGTYPITISGAEAQNYGFEYQNGTLTIKPKPVNIAFDDDNVKAICVSNWDTNGDGELSKAEAAAVIDIGMIFNGNKSIKSFNEFQFFVGLESIETHAFSDCSNLVSIVIPNSVTSLGWGVFENCSSLSSVTIPNSITELNSTFRACKNLTTVTIPNTVTELNSTFYGCSNLISVIIPNSVKRLSATFCGCSSLTSITIPKSVTKIESYTFNGCAKLTSISIPNSVTSVDDFAFYQCSGLTTIDIPYSVKSFGDFAFAYCKRLTSLSIPNSVTTIGNSAFAFCKALTSVVIPYSVTTIGSTAFEECSNLTSVTISNSVTTIQPSAFSKCESLKSLTLGNSVNSMDGAFYGCSHLENIYSMIEDPDPISEGTFSYYYNGNSEFSSAILYVPIGSKEKYKNADGWKLFTNIIEKDYNISFADVNVKTICVSKWDTNGDGELSLAEATAVTDLGTAFKSNYSISSFDELQFFEGLTSINDRAFYFCDALTSITLPKTVTSIGEYAFYYCSKLTSINLPNSISSIGSSAFENCYGLSSISIPNSVISINDNTFAYCSKLITVNIPNSVTTIGEKAFYKCTDMTSVIIPNSVSLIGNSAFSDCRLSSITLPHSVTNIGEKAFAECHNLEKVYSMIKEPSVINKNVFQDNNVLFTSATLYVLTGTKNVYQSTEGWKYFTNIVEMEDFVTFADSNVKAICVSNWDTNGDGELSYAEASSVTDLGSLFKGNKVITSFEELQFFVGLEELQNESFYGCSSLTSIIIPSSVSILGKNVFSDCESLVSIDIPNSITSIGENAFWNCSSLSSVVIPNSVLSIGAYSFAYCSNLKEIVISQSVNSIGEKAFYGCTSLNEVRCLIEDQFAINDNVFQYVYYTTNTLSFTSANLYVPLGTKSKYQVTDGWKNFANIIEMENNSIITFADAHVKAICVANWDTNGDGELSESEAAAVKDLDNVFQFDEEITSFDEFRYFVGITSVGMLSDGRHGFDMPFSGCTNLASITLPPSMTKIGRFAFYECTSLSSITIPKAVTWIDSSEAFANMALKTIIVEDGNAVYDSRENCNAIIETETNKLIIGFATTVIPNTVTAIEVEAFYYSDIEDVTIPQSVVSIGDRAFYSWKTPIKSVTVEWQTPIAINQSAFQGNYNATLYVPAGCKAAYEAAQYWQDFKEIKEIGGSELIPLTVGVEDVTVRLGSFIEDRPALSFDFENDETMWGWGNDQEMGIAEGSYNGTKYQTTTNPRQVEFWENQIAMGFSQLVPGEVYVLEFWAKSDKSFWLNANLQYPSEEAGWPSRGDFDWVEIGTEWQKFTMTTTVTGPNATQLVINIGELDGGTFCLDDISLRRKNPLFKLTYEGFVDGDDETTAFTTLPVASTTATNNSPVGTYPITVSGGVSEKYSITYRPGTLTIVAPIKGDANNDGVVDMKDVVAVVNCLLGITSETFDKQNADMNNDGYITITDAVAIVMGLQ